MWITPIEFKNQKYFLKRIAEIALQLEFDYNKLNKGGLFTGRLGIANFYFYYSVILNDEYYAKRAVKIIQNSIDDFLLEDDISLSFCEGLAGMKWILKKWINEKIVSSEFDEILPYDDILLKSASKDLEVGEFDFLYGALGKIIVLLDDNKYKSETHQLIDALCKICKIESNGSIKWESVLNFNENELGYDFGIPHGMGGIIAFLCQCYSLGINKAKCDFLLNGTLKFILENRNQSDETWTFPSILDVKNNSLGGRLAWCYGDLGLGLIILRMAVLTNNESLRKEIIKILIKTTNKQSLLMSGVTEAGLCHGSAGVAHIYNRIFNYTNIDIFKKTSENWFKVTIDIFEDNNYSITSKNDLPPNSKYDLINGISGIGLSLISGAFSIEPKWDGCLLLS